MNKNNMKNLSAEKFNEKTMTEKVNDKKVDKKVLLGSAQKDNMTIHIYQTHEKPNQVDFSVSIQWDDEKEDLKRPCKCKCTCKHGQQPQVHFAKKRKTSIMDKQNDQILCNSGFSSDDDETETDEDVIVSTPMENDKKKEELADLLDGFTNSDFEFDDDMWNTDDKVASDKEADDENVPYVYKTVAKPQVVAKDGTYKRKPFKPYYAKHRATLIQRGDKKYEKTLQHEPWLVARVEPKIYLGYFAGYCGKNNADAWLSFVPSTHERYELSPKALVKEFKEKLSPKTLEMMKKQDLVMGQALYEVGMNLEEPYHNTDSVLKDVHNNVLRYFGNSVKGFMKRYGVEFKNYKHHIERHHAMEELN